MNFGTGFGDLPPQDGGGFKEPEAKGYTVKILSVLSETSGAGNAMIRFDTDISQGPHKGAWEKHPKRLYQTYGNEGALARLKGIFIKIMTENLVLFDKHVMVQATKLEGDGVTKTLLTNPDGSPKMIPDFSGEFAGGEFDQNRLVNLEVGVITKYSPEGYLNIDKFVSIAEAAAAPTLPKPNVAPKASGGNKVVDGQDPADLF